MEGVTGLASEAELEPNKPSSSESENSETPAEVLGTDLEGSCLLAESDCSSITAEDLLLASTVSGPCTVGGSC